MHDNIKFSQRLVDCAALHPPYEMPLHRRVVAGIAAVSAVSC
jgi:hypothetical protein